AWPRPRGEGTGCGSGGGIGPACRGAGSNSPPPLGAGDWLRARLKANRLTTSAPAHTGFALMASSAKNMADHPRQEARGVSFVIGGGLCRIEQKNGLARF